LPQFIKNITYPLAQNIPPFNIVGEKSGLDDSIKMNKRYFISIGSTSRKIEHAIQLIDINDDSSVALNLLILRIRENTTPGRDWHRG